MSSQSDAPLIIPRIVDEFSKAWQRGERPSAAELLGRYTGHPELPQLKRRLLSIDLDRRLAAGDAAPIVTEYLALPGPELDRDSLVLLIGQEYERRWRRRERFFSRAVYIALFPDLALELASLCATWDCPRCSRERIPLVDESATTVACPKCGCSSTVDAVFSLVPGPAAGVAHEGSSGLDSRQYAFDPKADEIGAGGMGGVYRTRDPGLGRDLAIKILRRELCGSRNAELRFVQEAKITSRLEHPNIVPVHSIGRLKDQRLFYTMKLVRGRTLEKKLADCGPGMRERLNGCLDDFERVCQAMAYAHSQRVIHRDLKPANIMAGEFGQVQVMDWGLAKRLEPSDDSTPAGEGADPRPAVSAGESLPPADLTQGFVGTLLYAPREQVCGLATEIGKTVDVFALGAILCEILTGYSPYLHAEEDRQLRSLVHREKELRGDDRLATAEYAEVREGLQSLTRTLVRRAMEGDVAAGNQRLQACGSDPALYDLPLTRLAKECLADDPAARPPDAEAVALRVADYQAATRQKAEDARIKDAKLLEERKKKRFARLFATSLGVLLVGAVGAALYFVALAGRIQTLANDNKKKADVNLKLANENKQKADDNLILAGENQRRAKEAQEQRDASNRNLARVYFEKGDRAGRHEPLRSRLMFASSLALDDDPETRRRLVTSRSVSTRLLWSTVRHPAGKLLAASGDGLRVVTVEGGFDGQQSLVIWDAATGREVASYPNAAEVAVWSPDGRWLATADSQGNVVLRQPDQTTPPLQLRVNEADSEGSSFRRPLLAFTPDGSRLTALFALGIEGKFVGCRWEIATGQVERKFLGNPFPRYCSAWAMHPNGKHLALTVYMPEWERRVWHVVGALGGLGADPLSTFTWLRLDGVKMPQQLVFWDLERGMQNPNARVLGTEVNVLTYSPDGSRLALGGMDGRVRVLDTAGKLIAVCRGHVSNGRRSEVNEVVFGPGGEWLASATSEETTRIWDPDTGRERHRIWMSGDLLAVGRDQLWVGGHGVWDVESGEQRFGVGGPKGGLKSLAVSPDGKWVAGATLYADHVWDAETGKEVLWLPQESESGGTDRVVFNAAGTQLQLMAIGGRGVRGWVVPDGNEALAMSAYSDKKLFLSWPGVLSPDKRRFIALGPDHLLEEWDIEKQDKTRTLVPQEKDSKFYPNGHLGLTIRPDGKLLLMSTGDKLSAWDLEKGQEIAGPPEEIRSARDMTFLPKGTRCFLPGPNSTIQGWDTTQWKPVCEWDHPDGAATCLAVNLAGTRLASGGADGTVRVWELPERPEDGQFDLTAVDFAKLATRMAAGNRLPRANLQLVLRAHQGMVSAIAFAPDGNSLVSAGSDHFVRRWQLQDGRTTLPGHRFAFGPDGNMVATVRPLEGAPPDKPQSLVEVHDLIERKPLGQWKSDKGAIGLRFRPDGNEVVVIHANDVTWWTYRGGVVRSVALQGEKPRNAFNWLVDPYVMAVSENGSLLASRNDSQINLWDTSTGKLQRSFESGDMVGHLAISPSAEVLAWCSAHTVSSVHTLDLMRKDDVETYGSHNVSSRIAIDPRGLWIVSGGSIDGVLQVWERGTATRLWRETARSDSSDFRGRSIASVAIRPDGRWLASTIGNEIEIRDLESGRLLGTLDTEQATARESMFCPMGRQLAAIVGSQIRFWDVAKIEESMNAPPDWLVTEAKRDTGLSIEGGEATLSPANRLLPAGSFLSPPPEAWRLIARGNVCASEEDWAQAVDLFTQALKLDWVGPDPLPMKQGLALLAAGRNDDYRQACRRLLQAAAGARDPDAGEQASRVASLTPVPESDWDALLAQARRGTDLGRHVSIYGRTLGATYYRLGQYDQAIETLEQVAAIEPRAPISWLYLAMAHQRAGKPEQARAWLTRGQAWIDEFLTEREDGSGPGVSASWEIRLELRLLRAEAERIVNPAGNGPESRSGGKPEN